MFKKGFTILLMLLMLSWQLFVFAQESKERDFMYESEQLNELIKKAKQDIFSNDANAKIKDAVKLFFDLRRIDLLVLALTTRNFNASFYVLEYVGKLSTDERCKLILLSLDNDVISVREQKVGELRAAQANFLDQYKSMIISFCRKQGISIDEKIDLTIKSQRESLRTLIAK